MTGLKLRMVHGYQSGTDRLTMCLLVSDGAREMFIKTAAEADGTFKPSDISAMLRHFADTIDHDYSDKKEAA